MWWQWLRMMLMTVLQQTGWWDTELWLRPHRAHHKTCLPLTARRETSSPWLLALTERWVWKPSHHISSCWGLLTCKAQILSLIQTFQKFALQCGDHGLCSCSDFGALWLRCDTVVLIHSGQWNPGRVFRLKIFVYALCKCAQLKDRKYSRRKRGWISWHFSPFRHGTDEEVYDYRPF